MFEPVILSLKVALAAVCIDFIAGMAIARTMARKDFMGKNVLESLIILPMVLPPTVLGYGLLILLGKRGLIGGFLLEHFNFQLIFTWWAAVIASGQAKVIYPKHLPSHIRMALLDKGKAKRAPAGSPQASASPTPSLLYNDYKLLRDRAYFQHLMEVCNHDVTKASNLSGLSVPSIYRHLGLAGIPTRSRNRG